MNECQITQSTLTELWPFFLKHVPNPDDWKVLEASGYTYTPGPQHMHTLLGNIYVDVDLTVCDCGNPERDALFVAALMEQAAEIGIAMSIGQMAHIVPPSEPDEMEWGSYTTEHRAWARQGTRTIWADSNEGAALAMLRTYLLTCIRVSV